MVGFVFVFLVQAFQFRLMFLSLLLDLFTSVALDPHFLAYSAYDGDEEN